VAWTWIPKNLPLFSLSCSHSIWPCTQRFYFKKFKFSLNHIAQRLILDPPSSSINAPLHQQFKAPQISEKNLKFIHFSLSAFSKICSRKVPLVFWSSRSQLARRDSLVLETNFLFTNHHL